MDHFSTKCVNNNAIFSKVCLHLLNDIVRSETKHSVGNVNKKSTKKEKMLLKEKVSLSSYWKRGIYKKLIYLPFM